MSANPYPNWIEINLSAVEHNVKHMVDTYKVPLMAIVKADAYGHGSVEVGKAALAAGAKYLAVARYGEAQALRDGGITAPVLILGMITPEEVEKVIARDLTVTMYGFEFAEMLSQRAKAIGKNVKAHLKVDTGMGRLGVMPDEALSLARFALEKGNITLEGVYSHFANAGDVGNPHNAVQLDRMKKAVKSLQEANINPPYIHISNSAGSYTNRDADFTMVRAGSSVVGLGFMDNVPDPAYMRSSLVWKTKLASCKVLPQFYGIGYGQTYTTMDEEIIGSIPLGYGDGYRRMKYNYVLIDGRKIYVVAKECMDQTMLRLPQKYPMGTEVVIIGKQGNEEITVGALAKRWGVVDVDLTSNINFRVPRIYVRD